MRVEEHEPDKKSLKRGCLGTINSVLLEIPRQN